MQALSNAVLVRDQVCLQAWADFGADRRALNEAWPKEVMPALISPLPARCANMQAMTIGFVY